MANADQEGQAFAQRTAEAQVERLRSHAALAMMVASVAVGFILGRASAWLVPFEAPAAIGSSRQAAVASRPVADAGRGSSGPARPADGKSSKPPVPLTGVPAATEQKAPEQKEAALAPSTKAPPAVSPDTAPPDKATAEKAEAKPPEPARGPAANSVEPAKPPATPSPGVAPEAKKSPQGVTLLNPGKVDAGPDGQDLGRRGPETPAFDRAVGAASPTAQECERRYSSFRQSDGTYQPFGGGPRVRCPLLR